MRSSSKITIIASIFALARSAPTPDDNPLNLTLSIHPGDDFYNYVNQYWLNHTTLPEDKSRFGAFDGVADVNQERVRDIMETSKIDDADYTARLIADLYASGMDRDSIDESTEATIKIFIDEIDAIESGDDVIRVSQSQKRRGVSRAFFSNINGGADIRDSKSSIAHISAEGLALPGAYYFEAVNAVKLEAYRVFLQQILQLGTKIGETEAIATAQNILDFEIQIANVSLTPVEMRDIVKTNNFYNYTDLPSKFPGIPWNIVSDIVKLNSSLIGDIVIDNPAYYTKIGELLKTTPIATIKSYLKVCFLGSSAKYLSREYVNVAFAFSKILSGQKKQLPRWKTVVAQLNNYVGDAIGKIYVKKYFPMESKADILKMIKLVFSTLHDRIENRVEWMSSETKVKAQEKLSTMRVKIGFPDKWENFEPLEMLLKPTMSYLEKLSTISDWAYDELIEKSINKPVDRDEWFMHPHEVNAYYNPTGNEIAFPAAILVPPFYFAPTNSSEDNAANAIKNFGAIGAVIGHEIMHGFDDNGRQFDKDGNLIEWWTKEDAARYTVRSDMIISQYDQYMVLGRNVSGALTAGENIADLGGLVTSFHAMKSYMALFAPNYVDPNGFTNEQRFFIANADLWKSLIRDELAIQFLTTDPHSPNVYRVNGALSNLQEFYDAFDVKPGNKMYRDINDRVEIF